MTRSAIITYTHRDTELDIRGQMLVDVRVTGSIIYECGDGMGPDGWFHHRCELVEMRMHDGFKPVDGEAKFIIYRAFCEAYPAARIGHCEEEAEVTA